MTTQNNGNITGVTTGGYCGTQIYSYDVSNRIATAQGGVQYSYVPGNKRVWKGILQYSTPTPNTLTTDVITFWSVTGQKLGDYNMTGDPTIVYTTSYTLKLTFALATANYYFGGKQIGKFNGSTVTYAGSDRLGSFGKYYPWGQEKPSATGNNTEKFTGYFRDAETGLDYAQNRYHQPGMGRFMTPDPYTAKTGGATSPTVPASWNRYAYVLGDPENLVDPTGNYSCAAAGADCSGCVSPEDCCDKFGLECPNPPPGRGGNPKACPPLTHDDGNGNCVPNPWILEVGYLPVVGEYNHLYIEVFQQGASPGTPDAFYVLDGGPSHLCSVGVAVCGDVQAWLSTTTGHLDELRDPSAIDFFDTTISGPDAAIQADVNLAVSLLSLNIAYNPILGPNSNSVVYTLLWELGIGIPITMTTQLGIPVGTMYFNGASQYFTGWGQILP